VSHAPIRALSLFFREAKAPSIPLCKHALRCFLRCWMWTPSGRPSPKRSTCTLERRPTLQTGRAATWTASAAARDSPSSRRSSSLQRNKGPSPKISETFYFYFFIYIFTFNDAVKTCGLVYTLNPFFLVSIIYPFLIKYIK
jgi:hypothetical protein